MILRRTELETIEPRWDVLLAIAEVTRLALESGHPDVAKSWTVAQEQFCHPQVRVAPAASPPYTTALGFYPGDRVEVHAPGYEGYRGYISFVHGPESHSCTVVFEDTTESAGVSDEHLTRIAA